MRAGYQTLHPEPANMAPMTAPLPDSVPIDVSFVAAARRLEGVVRRTPLQAFEATGLDLRLKLECLQETGSFKARGAWNQIAQLTEAQRAAGVVTTSSGNHGRALSWAAGRAGVPATICMPADAYPNKIEACRALGAEVRLGATRPETDALCRELADAGKTLIHPYNALRTIEGAGTVGLEIAEDWPDVEVVVVPIGGGGLISGTALALRDRLGARVTIIGVEPAGAATMSRALEAGEPVDLPEITTDVQGLCPLNVGPLNLAVAAANVDRVVLVEDADVFRAQAKLVNESGLVVEPAGAAALAAVLFGDALRGLGGKRSVAVVVSGGNPAPEQLAAIRSQGA
jgi:threonine dehydratase